MPSDRIPAGRPSRSRIAARCASSTGENAPMSTPQRTISPRTGRRASAVAAREQVGGVGEHDVGGLDGDAAAAAHGAVDAVDVRAPGGGHERAQARARGHPAEARQPVRVHDVAARIARASRAATARRRGAQARDPALRHLVHGGGAGRHHGRQLRRELTGQVHLPAARGHRVDPERDVRAVEPAEDEQARGAHRDPRPAARVENSVDHLRHRDLAPEPPGERARVGAHRLARTGVGEQASIAAATATGSRSTTRPAWRSTSGRWQPGETITGVPHAIASSAATGRPSERDSRQYACARSSRRTFSSGVTKPRKLTAPAIPSSAARRLERRAVGLAGARQLEPQAGDPLARDRHRAQQHVEALDRVDPADVGEQRPVRARLAERRREVERERQPHQRRLGRAGGDEVGPLVLGRVDVGGRQLERPAAPQRAGTRA